MGCLKIFCVKGKKPKGGGRTAPKPPWVKGVNNQSLIYNDFGGGLFFSFNFVSKKKRKMGGGGHQLPVLWVSKPQESEFDYRCKLIVLKTTFLTFPFITYENAWQSLLAAVIRPVR